MKKINFTIKAIEALEAEEKRYRIGSKKINSLIITVMPTGTKTFSIYKKINGKTENIKIARFKELSLEQVHNEANRLLSEIALGSNPQDIKRKQRSEIIFKHFFDAYMKEHAIPNKKTYANDQKMYNLYLNSRLTNKKLSKITRNDIQSLHNKITIDNGRTIANRVLSLISCVFSKAAEWEYFQGENPAKYIKNNKLKSRDRFLQEDELPAFLKALKAEPNKDIADYIYLSLFTGARKTNILSMLWKDVHLSRAEWEIYETKNNEPQTIPLVEEALTILRRRKQHNTNSKFVFPSNSKSGYLQDPKRGWKRILKQAEIKDLRLHDLRRTFGSYQAMTGASLLVIGKSLGHKSSISTQVYARMNKDPVIDSMKKAVELITRHTKKNN